MRHQTSIPIIIMEEDKGPLDNTEGRYNFRNPSYHGHQRHTNPRDDE